MLRDFHAKCVEITPLAGKNMEATRCKCGLELNGLSPDSGGHEIRHLQ
jgi:hypothetical protein